MSASACGVWPASRGLVAVLFDSAGRTRSFSVADTDDARWGLSQRLAAVGADLVLDEALLESNCIADVARRAGVNVWIAPLPLAHSLRCAAGIPRHGGARPSAALLARLPAIPWLVSLLRRLEPPDDRQITLL